MTRKTDPFGGWFSLGFDMWMLGAEASSVVALRTMKMAAGGAAADAEASRMVTEKIAAGFALSQRAMSGQLGTTMPGIASAAVADYRRKVRANRRRLTKR
jgi:hypothetical protein